MIYYQNTDEKSDTMHDVVSGKTHLTRSADIRGKILGKVAEGVFRRMYMRVVVVFLTPVILLACAYQPPQGQWINLDAESLYLEEVVLDKNAMSLNYKDVCIEAEEEIQKQLSEKLPARVLPLQLYSAQIPPQDNTSANIQILITSCKVDVQQWDVGGGEPSFTYYLDLDVRVSVSYKSGTLLTYNIQTSDQVSIDVASPSFEFSFEEPVARTLLLFDGRRLLIPD